MRLPLPAPRSRPVVRVNCSLSGMGLHTPAETVCPHSLETTPLHETEHDRRLPVHSRFPFAQFYGRDGHR